MSRDSWFTTEPDDRYNRPSSVGWWTRFQIAKRQGYGPEFVATAKKFRATSPAAIARAEAELEQELVGVRRS